MTTFNMLTATLPVLARKARYESAKETIQISVKIDCMTTKMRYFCRMANNSFRNLAEIKIFPVGNTAISVTSSLEFIIDED